MNKKQIENIVWHIETNRRVAGDKQVLDDVLKSLKNFLKETAPEVPVQEQYISTCSSCGYFNEIKLTPSFNPNYCMNCGSKTIYFQSNQGN
jgi:predicted RNA-binding Zn-ribbon protein involved in translation (DUF1610 family)